MTSMNAQMIKQKTSISLTEPGRLADFVAAFASSEPAVLQKVLETTNIEARLMQALYILKQEIANHRIQKQITDDVETTVMRRQKEFFLQEKLKSIRKELGQEPTGDLKERLILKFSKLSKEIVMPEQVKSVFDDVITPSNLRNLENCLASSLPLLNLMLPGITSNGL